MGNLGLLYRVDQGAGGDLSTLHTHIPDTHSPQRLPVGESGLPCSEGLGAALHHLVGSGQQTQGKKGLVCLNLRGRVANSLPELAGNTDLHSPEQQYVIPQATWSGRTCQRLG